MVRNYKTFVSEYNDSGESPTGIKTYFDKLLITVDFRDYSLDTMTMEPNLSQSVKRVPDLETK